MVCGLDKKSLKTLINYLGKVLYKKVCKYRRSEGCYKYYLSSDLLFKGVYINLSTTYSISKGRLSITKHDNKIFFGIENLLEVEVNYDRFEDYFIDSLTSWLMWFKSGEKYDYTTRREISEAVWKYWNEECGGVDRFKEALKDKKLFFQRGDLEIPCKGLDSKIIPIASLDLDDFKLRYCAFKSSDYGSKTAVHDIKIEDSVFKGWSSPYFLSEFGIPYGLFELCSAVSVSPLDITDKDDGKFDGIVKRVLKEMGY